MALVRGKEVFTQVAVGAGKDSVNRRIHRIEVFRSSGVQVFEGEKLPELIYISTFVDARVQDDNPAQKENTVKKDEPLVSTDLTEGFANIVVFDGDSSLKKRIRRIDFHREGSRTLEIDGEKLPQLVYVNTTRNEQGQNVMRMYAAPSRGIRSFSTTTLFLALICFIGFCTCAIVTAINAHRCFG
jgi:hypothetical protein